MTKVMITGAAGNLGSLLSRYIRDNEKDLNLVLMQHLKEIPNDISGHPSVQVRSADLIGDEGDDTLQSFLDFACEIWGCRKPWRMPLSLIYFAAGIFELVSKIFGIISPLTKDFIDIGRVSYYGDTSRFRKELLPVLNYPTINDGIKEMKV